MVWLANDRESNDVMGIRAVLLATLGLAVPPLTARATAPDETADALARACWQGAPAACTLWAAQVESSSHPARPADAGALAARACSLGHPLGCLRAPDTNLTREQKAAMLQNAPPLPNIAVLLGPEGLQVEGVAPFLPVGFVVPSLTCLKTPCSSVASYPWGALASVLDSVRTQLPPSTPIIVAPHPAVPLGVVQMLLDTVAGAPNQPRFPEIVLAGGPR